MAFVDVPGAAAIHVGSGADGSIWHVGLNHKIYRWNGGGWDPGPDQGLRAHKVAADRDGHPWHIGDNGGIYRWRDGGWREVGHAGALALAAGGREIWHIGKNRNLYRWDGDNNWIRDPLAGDARILAVGADGRAAHVNGHNDLFQQEGSSWKKVFSEVFGMTAFDSVYVISGGGYRLTQLLNGSTSDLGVAAYIAYQDGWLLGELAAGSSGLWGRSGTRHEQVLVWRSDR